MHISHRPPCQSYQSLLFSIHPDLTEWFLWNKSVTAIKSIHELPVECAIHMFPWKFVRKDTGCIRRHHVFFLAWLLYRWYVSPATASLNIQYIWFLAQKTTQNNISRLHNKGHVFGLKRFQPYILQKFALALAWSYKHIDFSTYQEPLFLLHSKRSCMSHTTHANI